MNFYDGLCFREDFLNVLNGECFHDYFLGDDYLQKRPILFSSGAEFAQGDDLQ